jgi:hypothetical protein
MGLRKRHYLPRATGRSLWAALFDHRGATCPQNNGLAILRQRSFAIRTGTAVSDVWLGFARGSLPDPTIAASGNLARLRLAARALIALSIAAQRVRITAIHEAPGCDLRLVRAGREAARRGRARGVLGCSTILTM